MVPQLSLRQRNRLQAMRLVQVTAVDMFEAEGFDATTIEAIANACGVSPSTIYRHFSTKENIVLWDERDLIIDAELGERLGRQPAIQAFRDTVVVGLAERDDRELFLRRLGLIYSEPSIWAAAAHRDREDRAELAIAIASVSGHKHPSLADESVAAVCLAALDVALEHWQRDEGRTPLAELINESIHAVTNTA
ncbi:MAG: TetR family transcriptional regulator [Actinomycetia bacterium]|nr:TetR family transcriptional regulator [Actinomycetes bacterium]